jgi:hypothetical protein
MSIEDLRVSSINVLDSPHLSSCIAQIVCQCAIAQVTPPYSENSRPISGIILQQVDSTTQQGMLKSSKQQMERGDAAWGDKFTVMLLPHPPQYDTTARACMPQDVFGLRFCAGTRSIST